VIPGVCQKKGITYRRFRVKLADGRWGDHYVRLPDPSDPRFAEELARLNAAPPARRAALPGTMAALAAAFRAEITARRLAPATRENYRRYVDLIQEQHGHRLVTDLRPVHVYRIRDGLAAQPGKANNYLNVLKQMLAFAAERDWRGDNPAAAVDYLPLGEHEPWPAHVLRAALAAASPMLRLAIVTGLCSGQRIGDVVRMQHGWHAETPGGGRVMELTQQKTGRYVAVPMHPLWTGELAKLPRRAVTLLYDRSGKPFAGTDPLQGRIRRLMKDIGEEGSYSFHGLRKNACCYLLELGLSDTEVGAILGMDPETVRHYGKQAQVYMIAAGAAAKVLRGNFFPATGELRRSARKKPI
jgi:hypothetical protein